MLYLNYNISSWMETVMAWYFSVAGDEEAGPASSPLLCIRRLLPISS